jgi:hypothetical protein
VKDTSGQKQGVQLEGEFLLSKPHLCHYSFETCATPICKSLFTEWFQKAILDFSFYVIRDLRYVLREDISQHKGGSSGILNVIYKEMI